MKIGTTGTQYELLTHAGLDRAANLLIELGCDELHHGDCVGWDEAIHILARKIGGIRIIGHPPINTSKRAYCDFDELRPAKDYIPRNHDIVDETEQLIAAPRSKQEQLRSGTWATIRYARKLKRKIYIVGTGYEN